MPGRLPLSTMLISFCWNRKTSLERCLAVSVKPIMLNSWRSCSMPLASAVNSTNSNPSVPMGLCCSIFHGVHPASSLFLLNGPPPVQAAATWEMPSSHPVAARRTSRRQARRRAWRRVSGNYSLRAGGMRRTPGLRKIILQGGASCQQRCHGCAESRRCMIGVKRLTCVFTRDGIPMATRPTRPERQPPAPARRRPHILPGTASMPTSTPGARCSMRCPG